MKPVPRPASPAKVLKVSRPRSPAILADTTRPLAYEPRHALNAICPYFTMFPLEYPLRVLRRHRGARPVVMDPFCGRGTTLYAARVLGLQARGIDTSPVAVAIAQAKLCEIDPAAALALASELLDANKPGSIPRSAFFRHAFDHTTLRQICAIREGLLGPKGRSEAAVLLRAAMLGCLHGPRSKHVENAGYFSNQMPRTFASKPDYSVRYWQEQGLIPPQVDVLAVLTRKLQRLDALPPKPGGAARACLGDSSRPECLPAANRDFGVVVTSPPYYGMKTYVEDQWLRNWFLGGPAFVDYGRTEQICHTGTDVFAESLGEVWRNMASSRANRVDLYVRFGVVPSSPVDAKTLMFESLEASEVEWICVNTRAADTASSGRRQAAQMAAESAPVTEWDFHVVRE